MSFDESLEEEDEEISNCDHSEYESDNSKNSGMGCKSLSTVPNEILCGVESYNSDGLNHGSSKNNIKLCNCDDSGCDCDAEDRYNEYKCKHQMENPELYKLKFKLENPQLFPKIHRYLQAHPKLRSYLFPNRNKTREYHPTQFVMRVVLTIVILKTCIPTTTTITMTKHLSITSTTLTILWMMFLLIPTRETTL